MTNNPVVSQQQLIHRRAQAKYQKSAKGRGTLHRYNTSPVGLAAKKRYRVSSGGQIMSSLYANTPDRRLQQAVYYARVRRAY